MYMVLVMNCYEFVLFRGGWLSVFLSKDMGVAYTSEYGSSISLIYRDCRESAPLFSHCTPPKRPNSEHAWLFKIYCLIDVFKFKGCGSLGID